MFLLSMLKVPGLIPGSSSKGWENNSFVNLESHFPDCVDSTMLDGPLLWREVKQVSVLFSVCYNEPTISIQCLTVPWFGNFCHVHFSSFVKLKSLFPDAGTATLATYSKLSHVLAVFFSALVLSNVDSNYSVNISDVSWSQPELALQRICQGYLSNCCIVLLETLSPAGILWNDNHVCWN